MDLARPENRDTFFKYLILLPFPHLQAHTLILLSEPSLKEIDVIKKIRLSTRNPLSLDGLFGGQIRLDIPREEMETLATRVGESLSETEVEIPTSKISF